ncbi:MAG: NHL repeat-containing protein, partial [Bacillota bacterium]
SIVLCAALVLILMPATALAVENIGAWRGDWETIGGLSNGFLFPAKGVATDSAGNVYAADPYSHRVRKMTAATGQWQILPTDDGPFGAGDYPWGVAVDSNDNVYVLNSINANGTNGVWKYAGGAWTDITHGAPFGQPQGIAVDRNGNVYVANTGLHTIVKLPSGSSAWTTIGDETFDYGVTFNEPIGIATDQNNNVYVTDKDASGRGHVYRLLNGSGNWTTPYSADNLRGVAADPSGNIYVLEGTIIRMWPGSSITNDFYTIKANPAFSNPYGLAVGSDGRVYVTSQDDDSRGLISGHQGWATQLEWGTQPVGGASGQSFTSQPVLRLLDAAGNLMTGFSGDTVTISLNATNGATLGGTATAML